MGLLTGFFVYLKNKLCTSAFLPVGIQNDPKSGKLKN